MARKKINGDDGEIIVKDNGTADGAKGMNKGKPEIHVMHPGLKDDGSFNLNGKTPASYQDDLSMVNLKAAGLSWTIEFGDSSSLHWDGTNMTLDLFGAVHNSNGDLKTTNDGPLDSAYLSAWDKNGDQTDLEDSITPSHGFIVNLSGVQ